MFGRLGSFAGKALHTLGDIASKGASKVGHFANGASNAARGTKAATGGLLSGFIREMPHGAQALDTRKTTAKAGVKIGKLADSLRGAV
ncbi:hypothetical protein WJX72_009834 [[Myrmecia] bisecta]|uniref:Uncharacterized protein n=1 Tax=[Myrmecia] bisecta TaxID=41462 RepID=A0AAW1P5S6_9CHLO